jgi:hypothetical protein
MANKTSGEDTSLVKSKNRHTGFVTENSCCAKIRMRRKAEG